MARRRSSDGNKSKVIMSALIAILMIMSVFGIVIGSYTTDIKYGGHKFSLNTQGQYETNIDDKNLLFYTLPPEALIINSSQVAIDKILKSSLIVTTFNPRLANESLAYIELARFDIAAAMPEKFIISAVSEFSGDYAALAIVDCANASAEAPVIYFNNSDVASVYENSNCIYVNGKGSDFLKFRDRVLYEHYGVIENGKIS